MNKSIIHAVTLTVIALLVLASCNTENKQEVAILPSSNWTISKSNITHLLSTEEPKLIQIDVTSQTFAGQTSTFVHEENWGRNTFYSSDNKKKLTISNDYSILKSNSAQKSVSIRRRIGQSDEASSEPDSISVELTTPVPIYFISPYIEDCSTIPYCYYEDMEIQWNADVENEDGVAVIVEWDGVRIGSNNQEIHVINYELFPDNGVAILSDELFESIPDNALVRLYLVRINILQIQRNGTDFDVDEIDWNQIIAEFPELEYNCYTIALGSAASFEIILVKEL